MKMTTIALVTALLSIPALATAQDFSGGEFSGSVASEAFTGGIAVTGGIAAGNTNGFSSVRNEQFSANFSSFTGNLTFNELDGNFPQGGGLPTSDIDGIETTVSVTTVSEGVQESSTRVRDRGTGTAGLGGGIAVSGGLAEGDGSNFGFGFASW